VAYGVKFLLKAQDLDFTVPKMEAFWFVDGGLEAQAQFASASRDEWCWKIIIRIPDFVESDHFFRAVENSRIKSDNIHVENVKFELVNEGRCAQILHIGSYEEEARTIQKLHEFITRNGCQIANYHHEIYLSDPRKTSEEKLKTIIRYAVK
jgi:hypothetical protein